MDVVVDTKIVTEEETSNITKFLSSSVASPLGVLETERVGSLLRCCRYNSSFTETIYGSDPDSLFIQ